MNASAMLLAGYLSPATPNDWFTFAFLLAVAGWIVWTVFREGGDE